MPREKKEDTEVKIKRTQRGGNKTSVNFMKYNIFSVSPVVMF
jgi:hypothetical protein